MSTTSKMCCICRFDTPNLIDLKYKDEATDILAKLKEFIDLNVMEQDPKLQFICLPCYDNLDVAYNFKQKCDKSMAANRLRAAKMAFKCKTCPSCFETAKELEKHCVTHPIDLTEDDEPKAAAAPKGADQKYNKNRPDHHDGEIKMRFKIPMRPPKKETSSSKKKTEHKSVKKTNHMSASHHSSTSQRKNIPNFSFKCPICTHKFLTRPALSSHIKWHDIKKLQYKCPGCSLFFLKKEHMNEHIRRKH